MARKRKDNPTNMAQSDVADTLVRASGELEQAQAGLNAARMPINAAKAAVKATGIDFDIFNMFHKIRHLEDDDQRQRRINKLRVAWQALLADKVHPDLFGADAVPAVAPAVQEELRNASDTLREVEPEDVNLPFDAEPARSAPTDGDAEESTEDPAPLAVATDMPEGAGFVANAGLEAGRHGAAPEDNPHEAGSVEHGLWERGRARGAAQVDTEDEAGSEERDDDTEAELEEQPENAHEALDARTVVPFPAAERAASIVAAE